MCFNSVIVIIGFYLFASVSFSQTDSLNHKDDQGFRQGYWVFYGRDFPERSYCDTCKVEEGNYLDNRKNGVWKIYYSNGNLKAKASFVNGRPFGYYEKYYEKGMPLETGYFDGKNKGNYCRYYENGCIQIEKYYDINGKDSLPTVFYYENCDTSISKYGTIKFKRVKSEFGLIVDSSFYEDGTYKPKYPGEVSAVLIYTDTTVLPVGPGGPDGGSGITKAGPFNPNGYNKVYNSEGDLWLDGEFKNSKLWNGKLYNYDSTGLMLKIEIWKNGAYHSDAPLDYYNFQKPKPCCCKCKSGSNCDLHGPMYIDGEFDSSCCLINGKVYYYDKEGILFKIEIWKNGVYYSDGKL